MKKFDLKKMYETALSELDNNVEHYKGSPWFESLKVGLLIQISALYDGSIRLSLDDKPKKIVQTYCISMDVYRIIGYETEDKNIYLVATSYSAYYGYVDKNMILHRFVKPEDLLGVKINVNHYIITQIKQLKSIKKGKLEHFFDLFKRRKKVYVIYNSNLGHHIWNEQPVIDFFIKNKLFKFIDKFVYSIDFFGLKETFDSYKIPSALLAENNFVTKNIWIHFSSVLYTNVTSQRLLKTAEKCNIGLDDTKLYILIHQRANFRTWRQQKESFFEIINYLGKKYPDINFIIDGFSSPQYAAQDYSKNAIENDLNYYQQWEKNLSEDIKKRVFSIFGEKCLKKILYYNKASLLIMSYGTPEHYNWITQKPVVLYGPSVARNLSNILNSKGIVRGLSIDSTLINQENITEYPDLSYDMDYQVLLDVIDQKLMNLQKS